MSVRIRTFIIEIYGTKDGMNYKEDVKKKVGGRAPTKKEVESLLIERGYNFKSFKVFEIKYELVETLYDDSKANKDGLYLKGE
jgi:hypothetical protein